MQVGNIILSEEIISTNITSSQSYVDCNIKSLDFCLAWYTHRIQETREEQLVGSEKEDING